MKQELISTDLPLCGSGVPRSEGLHVSKIIHDLADELGFGNKPSKSSRSIDESMLNKMGEIGFMWEDVLSRVFGDRLGDRPGEIEDDGIIMSPDGINVDDGGDLILEEYKFTWRSDRRLPMENWVWMAQTKAYCRAIGATAVVFRVLYCCGDYTPPFPKYYEYKITFTYRDLEENWSMILNHARGKGWLEPAPESDEVVEPEGPLVTYKIRSKSTTTGEEAYIEVDAEPVTLKGFGKDFFIHEVVEEARDTPLGSYIVTDNWTGYKAGQGATKGEAVTNAVGQLKRSVGSLKNLNIYRKSFSARDGYVKIK